MSSSFILNTADRERLTAAHPQVFNRSFMQRYGLLVGLLAVTVYLIGCFFFFNVGPAFMQGRWDRASSYIQDWYSWRAQPRLRFEDGKVQPQWSSRGQYPTDAKIDWLQPLPDGGYSVVYAGSDNRLDVTPTRVDVYVDGKSYPVVINDDAAVAPQGLPDEIQQDGK
jgi:phosphonate transport system permease protein